MHTYVIWVEVPKQEWNIRGPLVWIAATTASGVGEAFKWGRLWNAATGRKVSIR